MAKHATMSMVVDAPPDALLDVLTDPVFHKEHELLRDDTIEASVQEVSRTEEQHIFEVHALKYARGMRGIDRSKRERAVTRSEWDLRARTCEWRVETHYGDRVQVGGKNSIEPVGQGARLTTEYRVSVKIPLLGGQIEKLIMTEINRHHPTFEGLVRRYCGAGNS